MKKLMLLAVGILVPTSLMVAGDASGEVARPKPVGFAAALAKKAEEKAKRAKQVQEAIAKADADAYRHEDEANEEYRAGIRRHRQSLLDNRYAIVDAFSKYAYDSNPELRPSLDALLLEEGLA